HEVHRPRGDAHRQRGQGRQPRGLRRDVEAAGHDRVGVTGVAYSRHRGGRNKDATSALAFRSTCSKSWETMKIVIIGGTGLIGPEDLALFRPGGRAGSAPSPDTAV